MSCLHYETDPETGERFFTGCDCPTFDIPEGGPGWWHPCASPGQWHAQGNLGIFETSEALLAEEVNRTIKDGVVATIEGAVRTYLDAGLMAGFIYALVRRLKSINDFYASRAVQMKNTWKPYYPPSL